jgi:crossover junction endodeoxyribonuclease RuvC
MIVGVDVGASGAIAWMTDEGHLIEVRDLPHIKGHGMCPAMLAGWLREPGRGPVHAFVERVASRPGQGVVSVFTFGRAFGMIEGVLGAEEVPVTMVTPAKWKAHFGLGTDKNASRARAAQLWPGLAGTFARAKDDGRAEAALIALYGANSLHGAGKGGA